MRVSMKRLETSQFFFIVAMDAANLKTSALLPKCKPRYFLIHEKQTFEDPYETLWRDKTTSESKAIRYKQYCYNSTVLFTETEN